MFFFIIDWHQIIFWDDQAILIWLGLTYARPPGNTLLLFSGCICNSWDIYMVTKISTFCDNHPPIDIIKIRFCYTSGIININSNILYKLTFRRALSIYEHWTGHKCGRTYTHPTKYCPRGYWTKHKCGHCPLRFLWRCASVLKICSRNIENMPKNYSGRMVSYWITGVHRYFVDKTIKPPIKHSLVIPIG